MSQHYIKYDFLLDSSGSCNPDKNTHAQPALLLHTFLNSLLYEIFRNLDQEYSSDIVCEFAKSIASCVQTMVSSDAMLQAAKESEQCRSSFLYEIKKFYKCYYSGISKKTSLIPIQETGQEKDMEIDEENRTQDVRQLLQEQAVNKLAVISATKDIEHLQEIMTEEAEKIKEAQQEYLLQRQSNMHALELAKQQLNLHTLTSISLAANIAEVRELNAQTQLLKTQQIKKLKIAEILGVSPTTTCSSLRIIQNDIKNQTIIFMKSIKS